MLRESARVLTAGRRPTTTCTARSSPSTPRPPASSSVTAGDPAGAGRQRAGLSHPAADQPGRRHLRGRPDRPQAAAGPVAAGAGRPADPADPAARLVDRPSARPGRGRLPVPPRRHEAGLARWTDPSPSSATSSSTSSPVRSPRCPPRRGHRHRPDRRAHRRCRRERLARAGGTGHPAPPLRRGRDRRRRPVGRRRARAPGAGGRPARGRRAVDRHLDRARGAPARAGVPDRTRRPHRLRDLRHPAGRRVRRPGPAHRLLLAPRTAR